MAEIQDLGGATGDATADFWSRLVAYLLDQGTMPSEATIVYNLYDSLLPLVRLLTGDPEALTNYHISAKVEGWAADNLKFGLRIQAQTEAGETLLQLLGWGSSFDLMDMVN